MVGSRRGWQRPNPLGRVCTHGLQHGARHEGLAALTEGGAGLGFEEEARWSGGEDGLYVESRLMNS